MNDKVLILTQWESAGMSLQASIPSMGLSSAWMDKSSAVRPAWNFENHIAVLVSSQFAGSRNPSPIDTCIFIKRLRHWYHGPVVVFDEVEHGFPRHHYFVAGANFYIEPLGDAAHPAILETLTLIWESSKRIARREGVLLTG